MNYGLITVEPTKKDYVFEGKVRLGGLPLRPDGQWDAFLPEVELQAVGVETFACTSFGTLNCVEILLLQKYTNHENLSDRCSAKSSGTWPPGNDPHKVAETLRKKGCVTESYWPNSTELNTLEKYYSEIPENIKTLALELKAEFDFGHEWVSPDYDSMKAALMYSPLGVGVFAWMRDDNGFFYRPPASPDTHWVVIYGFEEGKYWKCFDSYTSDGIVLKKLRWDFGFAMVKRYTLERQVIDNTAWGKFVKLFRSILGLA